MRFRSLFKQLLIPPMALMFAVFVHAGVGGLILPLWAMVMALALSVLLGNRLHWHVLHLVVMLLAWVAIAIDISPGWYLLAAVLLALVYSGLMFTNVPLYFTGRQQVAAALARLRDSDLRIADLGAGIGSFALPIAQSRPDLRVDAFEVAPIPYFLGRWRCRHLPNVRWYLKPYENVHLGHYDAVYCFLSPEPMPNVWQKILDEMRPGARLVSNSFPVPNVEPVSVDLPDSAHPLFIYQVPLAESKTPSA